MEKIPAKSILGARNKAPGAWFGVDYNMNLYRGCCHGCIYCDSRSECYGTEDFDRVRVKDNCIEILRNELQRKVKTGVIGTGAMSDPYNPFEKTYEYTRKALMLMEAFDFGAAIATKSDLITRDIDVLKGIQQNSPVICKITITAADDTLARMIEPNAPSSSARFAAIEKLSSAGIYAGVLLMPVLPFIEDTQDNISEIIKLAGECGAKFIYPAFGMTTRDRQREHYYEKLDALFPGVREKHHKAYGNNYQCTSTRAKTLWNMFTKACDERGIVYQMQSIIRGYQTGYGDRQLRFF